MQDAVERAARNLSGNLLRLVSVQRERVTYVDKRLQSRKNALLRDASDTSEIDRLSDRLAKAETRLIASRSEKLKQAGNLLEALSYTATLKRGYAVVRDTDGKLVRSRELAARESELTVQFSDGDLAVTPKGEGAAPPSPPPAKQPKPAPKKPGGSQGSLF